MSLPLKSGLLLAFLAGGALGLSGCAQSRLRIDDNFGQAVSQDLDAQIADPEAGRNAGLPPPSSGARAALAQARYRQNIVIPPSTMGASGNSGYGANSAEAGAPVAATSASGAASSGP